MRSQVFGKNTVPLWIALLAYLALHATMQLYWAGFRPSPVEPDDAYTYILKAAQVSEGCGLQDCPAVQDLRRQLTPAVADPDVDWLRYRMLVRTTLVYHPLYTAAMLSLGTLGLSWEQTYVVISVLGVVLIGSGLCYFLSAVWGPNAAAVGLILVALSAFKGQGLLYIVPSNLSLAIALFLWGAAIKGMRGWPLVMLAVGALLMHPVGRLYCAAVVPMMLLMERTVRPTRSTIVSSIAVLLLVGASAAAPMLIERPLLQNPPEPWPAGASWVGGLLGNLVTGLRTVLSFDTRAQPFATIVAGAVYLLAWLAYQRSDDDHKRRMESALTPLVALCVLGLGYVLPHYSGEVFTRVWVPVAAILAGGAGYALMGPDGYLRGASDALRLPGRLAFARVRTVCLAFLLLAAASGAVALLGKVEVGIARGFETYATAQVRRAAKDCGTLLFSGETAALFYLSHGANACAARYLPATRGTDRDLLAEDLRRAPRPLLLVAPQPGPKELRLDEKRPLQLDILAAVTGPIQLKFLSDQGGIVHIRKTDGTEVQHVAVSPQSTGEWVTLARNGSEAPGTFRIWTARPKGSLYLEGIRISETQTTRWPWGLDVSLRYGRLSFAFSASRLSEGLFRELEAVDTEGSTVLAIVK